MHGEATLNVLPSVSRGANFLKEWSFMKISPRSTSWLVALLFVLTSFSSYAQNDGNAAKSGPIVVLMTIDGFPARALKDPRLPMPTLRSLIANGTHADAMIPVNPTVTWPNHTTLITGVDASVHHVVANGEIEFPTPGGGPVVKPWVPKDELVHAHTLYDALAEKGMTTGQVDWVAIYGAKNVRWDFGEKPDASSVIVQDLIAKGIITQDQVEHFGNSSPAWHDEVWTDAAIDILTHHTPNLLLFHLLQTDTLQHKYGALSMAAYAGYAYADTCLDRLIEAARAAGVLNRITFVIASDHGFGDVKHAIRPNVVLAQRNVLIKQNDKYEGGAWFLAEGGEASLYIRDAALRAKLIPELKTYFSSMPGVEGAFTNEEARAIGLPAIGSTNQAPDLYLTASAGYAFWAGEDGPLTQDQSNPDGSHGYSNTDPEMQALFVASGNHIRPGIDLGTISNLRVAPTIAKLLGVSLPAAKEQPLDAALQ
jgi:predicted AlkP superfamily pyrophosphatase or phosphodiesterase